MTVPTPPEADVVARRLALQARSVTERLVIETNPRQLLQAFQRHLTRAFNSGRLTDPLTHILKHLRLDTRSEGFTIYGARLGQANFARTRDQPHFTRSDGAWFDFLVAGRPCTAGVELLAYSCEIRFPDALTSFPRFVRFDLNLPGHANEAPGLRCHVHPGHDDLQAASPLMHPLDIVDLCVYGLTWPPKLRAS